MKTILIALALLSSFSAYADGPEVRADGLVFKNYSCEYNQIQDHATHEIMYSWLVKGHLVNRGDSKVTGAVCFDFYDQEGDHMGNCGRYVSLNPKRGNAEFGARDCPCKNFATVTIRVVGKTERCD
tara:strand:- start:1565 stop:1942 length:378 start_codon:yes stop_codon:yes gene_type:complete